MERPAFPYARPFPAARSFGARRRRERSTARRDRRSVVISRETKLMEFGIVTSLSRVNRCTAAITSEALGGRNTNREAVDVSMRLPGAQHQLLSSSPIAGILSVLFPLVTFQGTRACTERALPGSFAFPARTGAGAHRVDGARAAAAMAAAGAQTEWADVRSRGQIRSRCHTGSGNREVVRSGEFQLGAGLVGRTRIGERVRGCPQWANQSLLLSRY